MTAYVAMAFFFLKSANWPINQLSLLYEWNNQPANESDR